MNTSNIKKYAPKARREFIEAVVRRLNVFGIRADSKGHLQISEPVISGAVMQIDGNSFDSQLERPRNRLVARCETMGFVPLVEQVAYTWFNRLCAIRFMELHDYLDHGLRVLSSPSHDKGFEIIDHAQDAAEELELDRNRIIELKLAGNQDEQLYRELLLGQCHQLHKAMPFLFEALDDETELLLPDNLTRTDSILRGLVDTVPEEDWQQVEVIGWLYQFYISEKKDQVIGKVVKSEDIPAATQLFTPNWIVKYLVQNSVGRQWLQTYPDSIIKEQMEYYIEPAEQTPEVVEQLKAITPDAIEPETIKVLDPACGSGHILIEAYNVLKAIYEERGYRSRDIPQLILENNLFGLDIDDRAAQLAGFALMMMARADDKRIFKRGVKLNVLSLQESNALEYGEKAFKKQWQALNLSGDWQTGASEGLFTDSQQDLGDASADQRFQLLQTQLMRFVDAKTFGSLIEVPANELDDLKEMFATLTDMAENGDSMQRPTAKQLLPFVHQAVLLAQRYDAVVANPPYMGSKYQTPVVKKHLKENYKGYEKDLFSAFIIRNLQLAKEHGQLGFMTPFVWMFISSYEQLRSKLIDDEIISTLIQLEYSGFDGATVPICTFTLTKGHISDYKGCYIRLSDFRGAVNQGPKTLEAIGSRDCGWFYEAKPDDFKKIPGSPVAYWVNDQKRNIFTTLDPIGNFAEARQGMATSDNNRFLRFWHEIDIQKANFDAADREEAKNSGKKWFPYNKGGSFRKWWGNQEYLVNWENDGKEVLAYAASLYGSPTRTIKSMSHYFKPSVGWSFVSSSYFGVRVYPKGFLFDVGGSSVFPDENKLNQVAGYLCSSLAPDLMKTLNPTLNFQVGNIEQLPFKTTDDIECIVKELIQITKDDWDSSEVSWSFKKNTLCKKGLLEQITKNIFEHNQKQVTEVKRLETELNKSIYNNYELYDEEIPSILDEQITLTSNPVYRYGSNDSNRLCSDTVAELVSFSIGSMMGRYSLDKEGLVYAHANNEGFANLVADGAYKTFPADDDGIIPLTDQEWFKDDATHRFREFVKTVWGEEHLQENLDFVAESLCLHAIKPKKDESALATIRRYLSSQFYKDHLKTYKKRPIYWLFSSGKQKAFECLVYLHRYNEGTLARMRTEYVTPLLGKYDAYRDQLEAQLDQASATAEKNRLKKEQTALAKKQVELRHFDDKLKHYADRRITLDLDDGVKVNYGKFGDLLSDVKAITGKIPEKH